MKIDYASNLGVGMFNDQQNDQAQANTDIDTVAQEIGATPQLSMSSPAPSVAPSMGAPLSAIPPSQSDPAPAVSTVPEVPSMTDAETTPPPVTVAAGDSSLDAIKHDALEQLSPLVDKLDQPPEERYKTLMMMIQASDNQDLIKSAYEAANAIEDEKAKAEALLGIINEINYFTQQKQ